ncbi:MAG: glycosyltransferase, partial [Candidatus Dormibacteria bacterium]
VTEKSVPKKLIFGAEWRRTRRIEQEICRSYDHVIAVSGVDCEMFQREYEPCKVSVIPTGVDAAYFQPRKDPSTPGRLVFVGSMDWHPNEDGVTWFLKEVYPKIKKAAPHATFTIVGRKPSSAMAHAVSGDPSVTLTGRVEDVRPCIAEAEAVVVPLRIGGGTRIKIPEAMAMAKAVVSTHIGAEGLPFRDGKEILLEDDPGKFAEAVVDLLQNPSRRAEIEATARDCVVRDFGWNSVVDRMEKILAGVENTSHQGLGNFIAVRPAINSQS